MSSNPAAEPKVIESPAKEPARFFELDPDSLPEVTCPDCGETLDLDLLIRRHGNGVAYSIGAVTLGDVVDAANEHECADEDDDDSAYPGPQGEQAEWDLR